MATDKGKAAERVARVFLEAQGLQWVTSNYRCRCGEIDHVMVADDTLVFVEVKLRSNQRFGSGADSVTWNKQRKILNTAARFRQEFTLFAALPCRFDIVALEHWLPERANPRWIQRAFCGT